jgi:signal transduction histidine kinase
MGLLSKSRIHRTSAELAAANRELADARCVWLMKPKRTAANRARPARSNARRFAQPGVACGSASVDHGRGSSEPGAFSSDALRSEIELISQEVRRICEDLSPSALENVGLSAALQFALAHAVEHAPPDCGSNMNSRVTTRLDEKLNLPSSTQIQIYRIAQEALSNICRHANAKHVKMAAAISPESEFELSIADDGRGFDEGDAKKPSGRGVANIRARASMIDADVEWKKQNGGGTVFRLNKTGAMSGE